MFINYSITSPHFQSILVNDVKKSEFYAISFDESLNLIIQMGQIDHVVNFWGTVINKVSTRYLCSTFIGHARHKDLLLHFMSALDLLDKSNLLQVSIDGPNVNWAEKLNCAATKLKMI